MSANPTIAESEQRFADVFGSARGSERLLASVPSGADVDAYQRLAGG